MIRRLPLPLVVLGLILVMPRPAAAQTTCFSILVSCRTGLSAPWGAADFGAPRPVASVQFVTRSQASHGRVPGTADPMAAGHGVPGFSTAPYRFENTVAPIDCAMVRHGHAGIDSKMVVAPPARVTHSGVVVAVPPCKTK
jgi:hypothetical protein